MRRVPRRYSHFVFGVIQSGLTCAIASAIASLTHAWSIACESARRRNLLAAPGVTHTQLIGDRAEHQEHT